MLEIEPKHGRALRAVRDALLKARDWDGLEALYGSVRDFEGLVDVLAHEADTTSDSQLKLDLSFRTARVFEERISDPPRAVRSYERVLSVDPKNLRAAEALAAIYEQDAKWTRLRPSSPCLPLYGWFAEGLDPADLQEAKALLDELGG